MVRSKSRVHHFATLSFFSVYAASLIDETGLIGTAGPTYVSIRSAKHDRLTHESHAIDFDRLVQLKEFEKFARDHLGRVKPIIVICVDSSGLENNSRYSKTLSAAIDKFKKHNLDSLILVNQAPGQALFNVVERRLSPLSHDLAGLILPHDHFGTHLNEVGVTEHAELEKNNFKMAGDALAEVWSMNVLDEHPVVAEYINPSPLIDDQLKLADSSLALDGIIDRYVTKKTKCSSEIVLVIVEFVQKKMKKHHSINESIKHVHLHRFQQLKLKQNAILTSMPSLWKKINVKENSLILDIGVRRMFFKLNIPFKSFVVIIHHVARHGVRTIFKYFLIGFFHHLFHSIVRHVE